MRARRFFVLILSLLTNSIVLSFSQEIEYYPCSNTNKVYLQDRLKIKDNLKKYHMRKEKPEKIERKFNVITHDIIRTHKINKRLSDPIFHGHPKTREEMWHDKFIDKKNTFDQTTSLIKLIYNITITYLKDCTPLVIYDNQIKEEDKYFVQKLLTNFPVSFLHGYINDDYQLVQPKLIQPVEKCLHFIVFMMDVKKVADVIGKQSINKVVVVARSSQWAVQEFLTEAISRFFVNLLVIGQSFKDDEENVLEAPYILYTHILYTDGLGTSKPSVLCSWAQGRFSRNINLFPSKMTAGYAGHRFLVAAANQPPFVFKRMESDADGGNPRIVWDGIEMRILNLLAVKNNFSIEIREPHDIDLGAGDAVAKEVSLGRADIGIAGLYVTRERLRDMDVSFQHYQDCAAFITLASIALPRYRAILGPFHWHVWVALTFTYLIGIFPLAFSDKHTLKHLIHDAGEIENMFWYVFGTFTNCFTFVGTNSWSKTTKVTTRLLIGWYWVFTIIITSCYTGSIIAFVTLPIYPETVDTIDQLLGGFYRIGTLDRGGWEKWFVNSSDPEAKKLLSKVEFVSDVGAGIRNITTAFFWPYAFLGSVAELEYIVQANFSKSGSKRDLLHISKECFALFGVSMMFPNNSLYSEKISDDIRRMSQSGLLQKIVSEVRWEMQRSSSGKLLSVASGSLKLSSIQEKGLTLEDTQGMFLLLGAGFLFGAVALISEWIGGFRLQCRKFTKIIITSWNERKRIFRTEIHSGNENNITEHGLHVSTRSTSADSKATLEGHIINVSEDDFTVHYHADNKWSSRRSSSLDVEREVEYIFSKDEQRRKYSLDDIISERGTRQYSASRGTFGNNVNSHRV